jgi:hypothetical protein
MVTDETVERILSNKTTTGRLFVQVDDYCFPERDWDDFVVVVLNWWVSNALSLDGAVIEVDNSFMDGPFSYRTRREPGADDVSITFIRNGQVEPSKSLEVSYQNYLRALREGVEEFLGELGDLSDAEVRELRGKLSRLTEIESDPNA